MRNGFDQFLDRHVNIWPRPSDAAPLVVCGAASSFDQLMETVFGRSRRGPGAQTVAAHARE
eukprot:8842253-Pyramimonas_sp.AAC.1